MRAGSSGDRVALVLVLYDEGKTVPSSVWVLV